MTIIGLLFKIKFLNNKLQSLSLKQNFDTNVDPLKIKFNDMYQQILNLQNNNFTINNLPSYQRNIISAKEITKNRKARNAK